jgi:hypothetical protein
MFATVRAFGMLEMGLTVGRPSLIIAFRDNERRLGHR